MIIIAYLRYELDDGVRGTFGSWRNSSTFWSKVNHNLYKTCCLVVKTHETFVKPKTRDPQLYFGTDLVRKLPIDFENGRFENPNSDFSETPCDLLCIVVLFFFVTSLYKIA